MSEILFSLKNIKSNLLADIFRYYNKWTVILVEYSWKGNVLISLLFMYQLFLKLV